MTKYKVNDRVMVIRQYREYLATSDDDYSDLTHGDICKILKINENRKTYLIKKLGTNKKSEYAWFFEDGIKLVV